MQTANSDSFDFRVTGRGLNVRARGGGREITLPWLWLRDHCRAEHSFDAATRQRKQTPAELDADIAAVSLQWLADENQLAVQWNNDEPGGRYPADFFAPLMDNRGAVGEDFIEPKIWNAAEVQTPTADFAEVANGGGENKWLLQLAESGFVLIQNCPPTQDGARAVAAAIGHIRETIFGGLWTLESGGQQHQDTAYGYAALGAHTDSTYSHDAPGLQMLLCAELDSTGGESVLADGFKIAAMMQKEDGGLYEYLATLPVPGEYLENNVHLRASRPMFRRDLETGRLVQVSYNPYDRAAFILPPDDNGRFYAGARRFQELADAPEMAWERRLTPGECLLFDNWRLLHGRRAFRGFRKFHGCYLDREVFQSKLRVALGKTL